MLDKTIKSVQSKSGSKQVDTVLSEREIEVLSWLADGKMHVDIASILSISETTVKAYIGRAEKKLNANNKTHAVAIAIRRGFVKLRQI